MFIDQLKLNNKSLFIIDSSINQSVRNIYTCPNADTPLSVLPLLE